MTLAIKKIGLTISGAMLLIISLNAQSQQNLIGKWKGVEEPDKQIEIYIEKDGSFSGRALNNKYNTSTKGAVMLKKLVFDTKSKTFKGKMSPPDAKIELDATLRFVENNQLEVKASKLLMTKTFHLVRIK